MCVERMNAVGLQELVELFGGRLEGEPTAAVRDLQLDSRQVMEGDLFVALPGTRDDGGRYIADAASRGAVAVLTPHEYGHRAASKGPELPVWLHLDAQRVAGLAAAHLQGRPAEELRMAGVTGTNGKTTVSHLLGHLLQSASMEPAVLGTAGNRLAGGLGLESTHTTPDAPTLQRLLARHLAAGGRSVSMEVSSHALVQQRTAGVEFDVAIFTNLTREHLDYHGDMESYANAKARLFDQLGRHSAAVLNIDDPAWARMAEAARTAGARVVTYSTRSRADLVADRLTTDPSGLRFILSGMGIESTGVRLPLRGRYNVENALAATAAALLMGASPDHALAGLATSTPAPGRLESIPVPKGRGFQLFVDYAHSPDALERVLRELRGHLAEREDGGRLLCVFGCGGDRDRGKRPLMGAASARWADLTILTTDNPRSEDPAAICRDIVEGIPEGARRARVTRELDRREAIALAISEARPGDVVLVAGKGHEGTQQLAGGDALAFDDRAVARALLGLGGDAGGPSEPAP